GEHWVAGQRNGAALWRGRSLALPGPGIFRNQAFRRPDPGQFVGQLRDWQRRRKEAAGGELGPRKARPIVAVFFRTWQRDRRQIVAFARLEQSIVGKRSRRDDARYL